MNKKCVFLTFSIKNSSVSTMFSALCNALSVNYQVIVITDNISNADILNSKVKVLKWPSTRPTKFKDLFFLLRLIRKFKPSVMISMFGGDNLFLLGGFLCNVQNRISWSHTISSARSDSSEYLILRKRLFFKMATNFVANSSAMKEDLVNVYKINQDKIKVFYNVVERVEVENERDFNSFAFAGRLHPAKGLDVLIQAMHLVAKKHPDVMLNVLGGSLKGNVIKDYFKLVKDLKLERNVVFLGNQPKNKLLEVFSKSLAVVVPSFFEAFGLVVIEAFSVKTPVIGSNTGGIKEIVREGVDGYLVEPKNSQELSEKIAYLLDNRQVFSELSKNCYERFLSEFELESGVKKIKEYINALVEDK